MAEKTYVLTQKMLLLDAMLFGICCVCIGFLISILTIHQPISIPTQQSYSIPQIRAVLSISNIRSFCISNGFSDGFPSSDLLNGEALGAYCYTNGDSVSVHKVFTVEQMINGA